jgi:hypothetical protein
MPVVSMLSSEFGEFGYHVNEKLLSTNGSDK